MKPPVAFSLSLLALPALALLVGFAPRADSPDPQVEFNTSIRPMLEKYCSACHGPNGAAGGISVMKYKTMEDLQKDSATGIKILRQLKEKSMPPLSAPQPPENHREQMTVWLTKTLDNLPDNLLPKDPGHTVLRRLSRLEYNNTVRDLLGVLTNPADSFPADGGGGAGFDNNADTLFMPPILMERYLEAATEVLNATKPERLYIARPAKGVTAPQAARKVLTYYAPRAWRRPVSDAELAGLLTLFTQATQRGESYESSVKYAMKAVLLSPNFLYRVERPVTGQGTYPISDFALASRLSYFLWASTPDDELMRLAGTKKLHDPQVLDAQIKRMLTSSKASAFAESFASQWIHVKDLYTVTKPDPGRFPQYTPELRDAMYQEPILLFTNLLRENGSLLDLLDANYTYLNEPLAKHYGIPGVMGLKLRKVTLPDNRRGGVLTMASVLTLTSYPLRTSPVLRGKWVLSEMFGTPPPPPPPVVATLPPDDAPKDGITFRQRLEKHREKPECASCHARMDPIGFGLENFDAIGRWRDDISGTPVDASGTLTSGDKFTGPAELKHNLLLRKGEFVHNLSEKMLGYALGRGLESYDQPAVRKIQAAVEKDNYRSATLIREVVMSYPFQYQRGS